MSAKTWKLSRTACSCRTVLQRRCLSTEAAAAAQPGPSTPYPFSSKVRVIEPMKPDQKPLMQRIEQHVVSTQSNVSAKHCWLFSRKNKARILPGSIVQVFTYTSPERKSTTSFAGQLTAIRRRGVDTSFTLRAVLAKTGVEVRYNAASNMLQDIKLIARADKAKGVQKSSRRPSIMRTKRAKLYFLRDQPDRLLSPTGQLRAYEAYEASLSRQKEQSEDSGSAEKAQAKAARPAKSKKLGKGAARRNAARAQTLQ